MTEQVTTAPEDRPPPLPRMTYEEFLAWADEDTHAEWVDGEVVWMSPVTDEHEEVRLFVLMLLRHFVEVHALGKVLCEPFQMKTGPDLPGRSPDIFFIGGQNLSRLQRVRLDGPADLVVEVVSPESVTRDRVHKFAESERGGVREYWLLDPMRRQAEFFQLGEDGRYRPILVGDDGVFRSVVLPGFWLEVEWLWEGSRPQTLAVLRAWGLV